MAALVHIYATYSYFQELDWRDHTTWGILVYGVSITVYSLLSSLAHLFQSKSELAHYIFFSLDYAGIGIYGYGKTIIDVRHEKTDLKVFVTVIPKEGWVHLAASILLLA